MSTSSETDKDPLSDIQQRDLRRAAQQSREQANPRALQIANDVLARALRASRRSQPIAAHPPYDYLRVSDQVLISRLRHTIDQTSDAVAAGRIHLRVEADETLAEITIEVFAQYGQVLLDTADQVRTNTLAVIIEILGPPPTTSPAVTIAATHVHVSDITTGSPHLVDPNDQSSG